MPNSFDVTLICLLADKESIHCVERWTFFGIKSIGFFSSIVTWGMQERSDMLKTVLSVFTGFERCPPFSPSSPIGEKNSCNSLCKPIRGKIQFREPIRSAKEQSSLSELSLFRLFPASGNLVTQIGDIPVPKFSSIFFIIGFWSRDLSIVLYNNRAFERILNLLRNKFYKKIERREEITKLRKLISFQCCMARIKSCVLGHVILEWYIVLLLLCYKEGKIRGWKKQAVKIVKNARRNIIKFKMRSFLKKALESHAPLCSSDNQHQF